MPILTNHEIECIGQRVYRAYCALPQFETEPVTRVEPEVLAQDLLGLRVEYHLLSISGAILGLTARNKYRITVYDDGPQGQPCLLRKNTIFVDRILNETPELRGRHNFTLTHETSHHILWMLYPAKAEGKRAERRIHYCLADQEGIDREEQCTNALTSAILMPPQLLVSRMAEYGLGTQIKMLNRISDKTGYQKFSEMAVSLGVSKTALCIRMKKLGLIEKEYLRDPYALYSVCMDERDMALFS